MADQMVNKRHLQKYFLEEKFENYNYIKYINPLRTNRCSYLENFSKKFLSVCSTENKNKFLCQKKNGL